MAHADTTEAVLRASATTAPQDLAAVIANSCYEGHYPVVRAIGASAVNQTIKATIIANQMVASRGLSLVFRPGFDTVKGEGGRDDITAVIIRVLAA